MNLHKEPLLFKIVPWFIGIVFVLVVLFWIGMGVVAYFAVDEVSTAVRDGTGVKGVLERLWCGANGCN